MTRNLDTAPHVHRQQVERLMQNAPLDRSEYHGAHGAVTILVCAIVGTLFWAAVFAWCLS